MKTRYRNEAFLVELIINILVFSVSCAILVGLFGKAGEISKQTIEETSAKTEVRALVEELRAKGIENLEDDKVPPWDNGLTSPHNFADAPNRYALYFYYNADWERVHPHRTDDYHYWVEILVEDETAKAGTLQKVRATAFNLREYELYYLSTAHYMPS